MALHTLKNPSRLSEVLELLGPEDCLLIIDNAVQRLRSSQTLAQRLPCPGWLLSADVERAGLKIDEGTALPLLSYEQWVDLTEDHQQSILWD